MKILSKVTCFGYSGSKVTDSIYQEVYDVANLIAKEGLTIVNGGFEGIMEAVSHGARVAGGHVIGVTFYPKEATHFEGGTLSPNPWIDEEIKTPHYVARTLKLIELGEIYIVFNGGTGTISEFGLAWGLARIYYGRHKPLILYGDFWHDIIETFQRNMFLRKEDLKAIKIVITPEEVVKALRVYDKILVKRRQESGANFRGVSPEDPFNI